MIVVRFFEAATEGYIFESQVIEAKFARALSKTGEWTASIPLTETAYDLLVEGVYAELWYDETYCIGGIIQEININYDLDPLIEVKGREEIDTLYDLEGDPIFYPHAQSFLLQLFTLLDRGGWRLGLYKDIDRTKLVTIDLRTQRQLLTQIAKFLEQTPFLYHRYGGLDYAGQPMLDVSLFEDPYVHHLLNASPTSQQNTVVISSAKSRDDFTNRIYAGRAIGGRFTGLEPGDTVPRERTLESDAAIDADPTLAFDDEYPIYEEIVSIAYVVIPTAVGAIGGRQYSEHQAAGVFAGLGSPNGVDNYWSQYICKPPPGRLSEASFWTGTVVNEATLKSTNQLLWEVCEVNEITPHIPGTLLATGVVANDNWTANGRCRITFEDVEINVTYDKRIMLRFGFSSVPASGNIVQIRALTSSNNGRTMRYDRSTSRSAGHAALNYQGTFEVITTGTKPRGRRAFLENKLIVPQQAGEEYSTDAEIEEASIALYEWLVEQIKASDTPLRELPVTLSGFDLSYRPGDNVLLDVQLQFPSGARQTAETRTIESIEWAFTDQRPQMSIKFTPNTPIQMPEDTDVALWDAAEKDAALRSGQFQDNPKEWINTQLTVPIANRAPDTVLSDGTPAISIQFAVPDPPLGFYETRLLGTPYLEFTGDAPPVLVELISKPPADLIVLFAIQHVGWRPTDTATAYADIVWR